MRILVVEDEFERAGPLVERLRRLALRGESFERRAGRRADRPGAGVGYTLAKSTS